MATPDQHSGMGTPAASTPTGGAAQRGSGASEPGVVDKIQDKAGQVMDRAQEKAGPMLDQAQEKVGQVADQAREQATSRAAGQKERAVAGLGTVSQALRQTSQELRGQEQATIAQYVDKGAEQVERFSSYLRQHDVQEIVAEVEGFARRQPSAFVGGAFALGLLAARLLKSSGQRAHAASVRPMTYGGRPPAGMSPTAPRVGTMNVGRGGTATTPGTMHQTPTTPASGMRQAPASAPGGTHQSPATAAASSTAPSWGETPTPTPGRMTGPAASSPGTETTARRTGRPDSSEAPSRSEASMSSERGTPADSDPAAPKARGVTMTRPPRVEENPDS